MGTSKSEESIEHNIQKVRFRIKDSESEYFGLECRIIEMEHVNTNHIFCKVQVLWNTEPKTKVWIPFHLLKRIDDRPGKQ